MKGINHLVLTGRNLDALRAAYQGLGFTITPRGQHPFGTETQSSNFKALISNCFP